VTDGFKVGDFHTAYDIIKEHYVSNFESLESAVKIVILEPGIRILLLTELIY
jgi:hypothetical protein